MVQPFYSIDSQVKMYKTLKNEHQDQTVILMSVAFSSLNYVVYIPELVMVISSTVNSWKTNLVKLHKTLLQKLSGTIPFLTKGPMALFFGGKWTFRDQIHNIEAKL